MRIASIIANIILLLIVFFLIAYDEGWPRELKEQLIVCVFFVTPILTLFTLWSLYRQASSESWLSLFLQRKKLEEKAGFQS